MCSKSRHLRFQKLPRVDVTKKEEASPKGESHLPMSGVNGLWVGSQLAALCWASLCNPERGIQLVIPVVTSVCSAMYDYYY